MPTITSSLRYDVVGSPRGLPTAFTQAEKDAEQKRKKMPKSFIKIKPVTGNSEQHNQRYIMPKYLIPKSNDNIHIGEDTIKQRREFIEKNYQEKIGRRMQQKTTPIREAVVLLPDDNNDVNIECLFVLTEQLKKKYGIECFQWHIHNDEGHIDSEGKAKYNYHAHLVFDWTDHSTGKTIKLNRQDMSDIQTLTAECLDMERGIKGSKNLSLNHHQFRGYLEIKDKLVKELKRELKEEEDKRIREQIKEEEPRKYRGFRR